MKAILIVEYDDEFDVDDLMVDYTLFHQEKKVYKMFNEILIPIPKINKERLLFLRSLGAGTRELHCYELGHDDCIDEIFNMFEKNGEQDESDSQENKN